MIVSEISLTLLLLQEFSMAKLFLWDILTGVKKIESDVEKSDIKILTIENLFIEFSPSLSHL